MASLSDFSKFAKSSFLVDTGFDKVTESLGVAGVITGGATGFALGGPIGAGIGSILGGALSISQNKKKREQER